MRDLFDHILQTCRLDKITQYVKKNEPDFYIFINNNWQWHSNATFMEKVYCWYYDVSPICDKENTHRFHNFNIGYRLCKECANEIKSIKQQRHRASETENQKKSRQEKIQLKNNARSKKEWESIRQKITTTTFERYGVDHIFQLNEVREKINHQKAIETKKQRYGYGTPFEDPKIQEKVRQTIQTKYGVSSTSLIPEIKQKQINTNQQKYGVDNPLSNPNIRERIKQTNLERYGDEVFTKTKTFKDKQAQTYLEQYDGNPWSNPLVRDKIKQTNLKLYGVDNPSKSEEIQLKITNTNIKQYGVPHHSQKDIAKESLNILQDKEIFSQWFTTKSVSEMATTLGVHQTTIFNYAIQHGIHTAATYASVQETQISTFIKSLGIDIVNNSKSIIYPYEIDIFIPNKNIAIEFHGLYWHCDKHERITPEYHHKKYLACKEKGIRLIQIFEDEWEQRQDAVKNSLATILGQNTTVVPARKTYIEEIPHRLAHEFYEKYHHFGGTSATKHYGLLHNSQLVAVMSFLQIKPFKRLGNKYQDVWNLNRFATNGCRIQGGASKLLRHFEKNNFWDAIISYADLRWSEGNLYNVLGFNNDGVTLPDYTYTSDFITREHKFNHRKHRYKDKYDIDVLTENQIMTLEGYYKIWDCGKIRFIRSKT